MQNVGIVFSKEFSGNDPLGHIGVKLPVYLRLLDLIRAEHWEAYVLTKRTYGGNGIFEGSWLFKDGKFEQVFEPVKIDLIFDRSAGVGFPPECDNGVIWVNRRDFKILCWDKWGAYQRIGEYMPKTFLIEKETDLPGVLPKIKTDWVVLKPFNGLKGFGIFIGPKEKAMDFKFGEKYKKYVAQEFIDTSGGIGGIVGGLHDLRVAIANGKAVWCHVRVPPKGSFKTNVAGGGTLIEIDYDKIPQSIKRVVDKISKPFSEKYDNPIYSLDFGIDKSGKPYIFEINDQIGFPTWEMKNRDRFLRGLIENFRDKLLTKS